MSVQVTTKIPGLLLYENVVPDNFHNAFVDQLNNAYYEKNIGHYDGFSFKDDRAFDAVFYPMLECLFKKMKEIQLFKKENANKVRLGCSLVAYEKNGYILRHKDSTALSGDTIVVFSFNSPTIVNFYSDSLPLQNEKVLVPPKSMYVMGGESRNQWTHEILPNEDTLNGVKIARGKRFSLLLFEPGPLYREEILQY